MCKVREAKLTLRLVWIATIALCALALGLNIAKPNDSLPLYLTFEPALAIFVELLPDVAPTKSTPAKANLGKVRFGAGEVCCPGLPARNTINIASGEVMLLD
jgi:hypothetical protein